MGEEVDNNFNTCEVKYLNDKFIIKSFSCESQYNELYKSRRRIMSKMIEKSVITKWSTNANLVRVKEITNNCFETNTKTIIIGILIKQLQLQPSILKEMIQQNQLEPKELIKNYTSDTDKLFLQDGNEIIQITGNINPTLHVTGVCIGLLGRPLEGFNTFIVEDVCYASADECPVIPYSLSLTEHCVALISGLGFSKYMNENIALINALNLFVNIVRGDIASIYTTKYRITRVIIAGNCLGLNAKRESERDNVNNLQKWDRSYVSNTSDAVNIFDKFIYKLAQLVHLDIMPGDMDPTTHLLPQQPLHQSIFKKSKLLTSIKCVTNPHCAEYNGRKFLGCSGQNIKSVMQYSKLSDKLEALRKTLEWSHLAPTCPDTLFCYPFVDTDPFVITHYPDVYFVGNQEDYSSGTFVTSNGKNVVLVAVPILETKMSCVLINLNSLKPELLLLA